MKFFHTFFIHLLWRNISYCRMQPFIVIEIHKSSNREFRFFKTLKLESSYDLSFQDRIERFLILFTLHLKTGTGEIRVKTHYTTLLFWLPLQRFCHHLIEDITPCLNGKSAGIAWKEYKTIYRLWKIGFENNVILSNAGCTIVYPYIFGVDLYHCDQEGCIIDPLWRELHLIASCCRDV